MAKSQNVHICQACGYTAKKWSGRCDGCGEWNTLTEEVFTPVPTNSIQSIKGRNTGTKLTLVSLEGEEADPPRLKTGLDELDRVLGGGLVAGSVILIGGDPGIGKSTLLIQTMALIANQGHKAVYISGEEAIAQVRMRAKRLGLSKSPVFLGAETNLRLILSHLDGEDAPDVVVIDSIQTLWSEVLESAPGTVSQVRGSAQDLVRFAKAHNTCVIIVGHMTKDGQIAGPRTVEHMVDTVLYFEGERGLQFRILRGVKNRFGPIDEIGVFEMTGTGLSQVLNPSALFLGDRTTHATGTAIFSGMEGTRPFLMEIQALVAPAAYGNPRRAIVGWDNNRLSMLLAVLDSRAGFSFGTYDVFLSVVGGLKINEPAADLAVAAALISALMNKTLPQEAIFFGEISLSGNVRSVPQSDARLKESEKLGFTTAWVPPNAHKEKGKKTGLQTKPIADVGILTQLIRDLT